MPATLMLPAAAFPSKRWCDEEDDAQSSGPTPTPGNYGDALPGNYGPTPTPGNHGNAFPANRWQSLQEDFSNPPQLNATSPEQQQQEQALVPTANMTFPACEMVPAMLQPQQQATWVCVMVPAPMVPAAPVAPQHHYHAMQMQQQQQQYGESGWYYDEQSQQWPQSLSQQPGNPWDYARQERKTQSLSCDSTTATDSQDDDDDDDDSSTSNSSGKRTATATGDRPSKSTLRRNRRKLQAWRAKAEQVQQSISAEASQQQQQQQTPPTRTQAPNLAGAKITKRLCAELKKMIAQGGEAKAQVLRQLRGKVLAYTFDREGCRVVQDVFEKAKSDAEKEEAIEFAKELKGSVRDATTCDFGNFVIQKAVETVPGSICCFIVLELLNGAFDIACNKKGCRIMQRLLEHAPKDTTTKLFDEVLLRVNEMCYDEFGHFVMETMLKEGTPEQKAIVENALEQEVASNKFWYQSKVKHVVEAALKQPAALPAVQARLRSAYDQYQYRWPQ